MSSHEGNIEHIHRSQVPPDSFLSDKAKGPEESYKLQCEDCLNTSLKKEVNKTLLDSKKAVEQVQMLADATKDEGVKEKLLKLVTILPHDNPSITSTQQLRSYIDQAFSQTLVQEFHKGQDSVKVSLNVQSQNPFKMDNPFAPKVLQSAESQAANQHNSRDKKSSEKLDKEKPSLEKKVQRIEKDESDEKGKTAQG